MATINGYYVTVEQEDPSYEVDITEQPVENAINVTDHVQRKARTMSISGFVAGENAAKIRTMLISASDNGEVVKYVGRNLFNGLISSLTTGHSYKVADGFTFSLTVNEVRVAKPSYASTLPAPIKAQAAPIVSSGRKQTKTKGAKATKAVEVVKFKSGSPWAGGS